MRPAQFSHLAFPILLALTARAACAADAPDAAASMSAAEGAESVSVTVTGIKSPLEVPYQRAYEATRQVAAASNGLADLVFKLRDKDPIATPIHVSVEYGDIDTPIPLDASNGFVLVPDDTAAAEHASLVVNRQSHSVSVQVDLRPHAPASPPTLAQSRKMVEAGRAARATLLPWYARIVTPTIQAVRVCSHEQGAAFGLRAADGSEEALASIDATDVYGRSATCTDIPTATDAGRETAVLVAPADISYDFVGTLF